MKIFFLLYFASSFHCGPPHEYGHDRWHDMIFTCGHSFLFRSLNAIRSHDVSDQIWFCKKRNKIVQHSTHTHTKCRYIMQSHNFCRSLLTSRQFIIIYISKSICMWIIIGALLHIHDDRRLGLSALIERVKIHVNVHAHGRHIASTTISNGVTFFFLSHFSTVLPLRSTLCASCAIAGLLHRHQRQFDWLIEFYLLVRSSTLVWSI